MEQLAGQVAVVTGAGSGIGRGIAAALASKAWAHFGHGDIAVNNAGVFPPVWRAISIDERDARWVLEVNLMGTWYGCSAFLPVREIVAERAAEILAAFDVQAPRYQGDEAIDTRAVMARPRTSAEGRP
jgi:NAD(P)-dependent dehydrogenase (short-subunit alcohol dehydrogenase family)